MGREVRKESGKSMETAGRTNKNAKRWENLVKRQGRPYLDPNKNFLKRHGMHAFDFLLGVKGPIKKGDEHNQGRNEDKIHLNAKLGTCGTLVDVLAPIPPPRGYPPPSLLTFCNVKAPSHTTSQASPKTRIRSSWYKKVNKCFFPAEGGMPSSSSASRSAFSA